MNKIQFGMSDAEMLALINRKPYSSTPPQVVVKCVPIEDKTSQLLQKEEKRNNTLKNISIGAGVAFLALAATRKWVPAIRDVDVNIPLGKLKTFGEKTKHVTAKVCDCCLAPFRWIAGFFKTDAAGKASKASKK